MMIDFDLFADVKYKGRTYSAIKESCICPLVNVLETNNYKGKYLFLAPASYGKTTSQNSLKIHLIKTKKTFIYIDLFKETICDKAFDLMKYNLPWGTIAIIDSLDEVYRNNRGKVQDIINAFEKDSRFSCIIVSSRFNPSQNVDGFSSDFMENFEEITIHEFNKSKKERLAATCKIDTSSFVYGLLDIPMYASMAMTISQNEIDPKTSFDFTSNEITFIEQYLRKLLRNKNYELGVRAAFDFNSSPIFKCAFDTITKKYCQEENEENIKELIPEAFNTIFEKKYIYGSTFYIQCSSIRFINYAAAKYIINKLDQLCQENDIDDKHVKRLLNYVFETDNLEMLKFVGEMLRNHKNKDNIIKALNAEELKQDTDWYFNLCLIIFGYSPHIDDKVFALGNCFSKTYCKRIFKYRYSDTFFSIKNVDIFSSLEESVWYVLPIINCLEGKSSKYLVKNIIDGITFIGNENNPMEVITKFEKRASISIPTHTTVIATGAFCNSILTSIEIPQSIEHVGDFAFASSVDLSCVKVHDGVFFIGEHAFAYCDKLREVVLPEGLVCIKQYMFEDCESLCQILLPSTLVSVDVRAFWGCKKLKQINIPDNVKYISEGAFSQCVNLQKINFTKKSNLISIEEVAFYNCKKMKYIELPNTLRSIGQEVFNGCNSIRQIRIPQNLSHIDCTSLSALRSLENIYVDDRNQYYTSIDGNLYTKDLKVLLVYACGKKEKEFCIPKVVNKIGAGAFFRCKNLESICMTNNIDIIEEFAFQECTNLVHVEISANVQKIGKYAFSKCKKLTSIKLFDRIEIIGEGAFERCEKLLQVESNCRAVKIGQDIFSHCTMLKNKKDIVKSMKL